MNTCYSFKLLHRPNNRSPLNRLHSTVPGRPGQYFAALHDPGLCYQFRIAGLSHKAVCLLFNEGSILLRWVNERLNQSIFTEKISIQYDGFVTIQELIVVLYFRPNSQFASEFVVQRGPRPAHTFAVIPRMH